MLTPQSGIFALGTASHAYLEFDLLPGRQAGELVSALASLREPRTTIGGINLVSGFRPELWRELAPDAAPADASGFNRPIRGADGYEMPATQHDAMLWLAGSSYDVVFDEARGAIAVLAELASVAEETSSWPYRHDRDLTGFIDGTKNPSLLDAPAVLVIPEGEPGAGGTILLLQKWAHQATRWESLSVSAQENVMGRTKDTSVELDPKPASSHVARTDQDIFGEIFRRNMPYGTVTEHGTMFVGFSSEQKRLTAMLNSMAGVGSSDKDALTAFTSPLTGAFYFVPSVDAIKRFIAPDSGH
jgi:putative iron-dependent peroxidase